MFIDESVDKPFRENFPKVYERLFNLTINEDGTIGIDEKVFNTMCDLFEKIAPGIHKSCTEEEIGCLFENFYKIGVYTHLSKRNSVYLDCNVPACICMALYNVRSLKEKVVKPEKLWDYFIDFLKEYSDYIDNIISKNIKINYEEKMFTLFSDRLKVILTQKKEDL